MLNYLHEPCDWLYAQMYFIENTKLSIQREGSRNLAHGLERAKNIFSHLLSSFEH
jgi:hypothetical protein